MVTPKIEREREASNYGKFVIYPLERGYGVTLGNALRRVLLSSLEGVAITSIRITDVMHEFSAIPGVREDVLQVMLQIKQIRLLMHEGDVSHLHLVVNGEGEVTASDIQCPAEVEILNPELYLFTVDNPSAHLEIDMTVGRGRGYLPANERSGHLQISELPVDAIFSPIRRVNWNVGSALYGQSTNYDKLELEIWTDGTIQPEPALVMASKILIEHLRYISGISEDILPDIIEKEIPNTRLTSETAETPIENLDLSVRVFNSLKRTGVATVGDVLELLDKGDDAVKSIRNFGEKSLDELREKLQEKGYLKKDKDTE
ncbi:DNA-directed RNA polymerase, alpha subunit, bacterial and chloroplast-type [Flexilinea flocculi]|jgi:DNA-directed RNA polymerase subunit alpha|uniref:DNA-directed RNA polymerase subunit alpha n=2 Tax=Flexilinea flocculi TaxID=1678840 RepID=A0A0K8PAW4_9CHLR|nr:DNA-directed RNA polymerase subunit alpha [Flexilinea flocculi]GAP39803.1 DNA-directed RNA polymerase, alpha subunit, bacterial and chloroplast-type [Flexilinea flocculi]